ncbi:MAG: response regulator [Prochloron sp. SP5CPC1]|nr:response regulator [Candidatus Paraprochloron terpiosi SP5CPC1]
MNYANVEQKKSKIVIPSKIVKQLIDDKVSGRLTIYDVSDKSVQWRVFMGDGKIHFASSAMGERERQTYLLSQLLPQSKLPFLSDLSDDYQYVCNIWRAGNLSLQQLRRVLFQLTREAVSQVWGLSRGLIKFKKTIGLDPLLLSLPLNKLIFGVQEEIKTWVQLRPEITSPFQRPLIENRERVFNHSWLNGPNDDWVENLVRTFNKNPCLYEVAHRTGQDSLDLALFLQPLVKDGAIKMLPYGNPKNKNSPLIACIDDSETSQQFVKKVLEASGFRVINIVNPARSMMTLARHKPDLILMDINMPEIDGYELCQVLKQSRLMRKTPITMLTGRDGLIDKIRAKLVGAVGYISKPCNPQ